MRGEWNAIGKGKERFFIGKWGGEGGGTEVWDLKGSDRMDSNWGKKVAGRIGRRRRWVDGGGDYIEI